MSKKLLCLTNPFSIQFKSICEHLSHRQIILSRTSFIMRGQKLDRKILFCLLSDFSLKILKKETRISILNASASDDNSSVFHMLHPILRPENEVIKIMLVVMFGCVWWWQQSYQDTVAVANTVFSLL